MNVPGGNIDYCLASVHLGKVVDFVGVELQTVDTTGTIWPERQRFHLMVNSSVGEHVAVETILDAMTELAQHRT